LEEEKEEELKKEEIKKALRKTKLRKAAGINGIPMEALKYAGKRLWSKLVFLIKMEKRQDSGILEEKHSSSYI